MRTALMVSLLTTIAAAQQPATEQLHDHLDGKLELSWLRLGERLVTATMDEDSSAVADALLAAMAATAPAERRSRAFATLDRWNELPCASDLPVAKQLLLQQALLPAITDPTLQPPARSTALLALGGLSPRLRNVWLGPAEARLRAALQHRSEQATDELLPACLRYLARVAPDSAFTLPAVIAVTLAADTSEPVLQAGLAAILAIGSRGSVADARAACSACAALLRDCSPERAEAVLTGMRQLLRAHAEVLDSESMFAIVLRAVDLASKVESTDVEVRRRLLDATGALVALAKAALLQLQPEAARQPLDERLQLVTQDLADRAKAEHTGLFRVLVNPRK